MPIVLGLDIGTTGCKAAAFDEAGHLVASHTVEYPLYHPKAGWAEQDPHDWWHGTVQAIRALLAHPQVDAEQVAAVGLSGQMHGAVLLDTEMQPVRRAIIWNDGRTTKQCEEITRAVGKQKLIELTGNPALEGFTLPKVLWVRENEPDIFKQASLLLLPKDYIRWRLTGLVAQEISDAAGTVMFDVRNGKWSNAVREAVGLPATLFPDILGSTELAGQITRETAQETGLLQGTPVVGGGADNACGAVGTGVVAEGISMVSLGTSGVVLAYSSAPRIEEMGRVHTFNHSVPNAYYLMGVTQGAGFSLRWARDLFRLESYDAMTQEAASVAPLSTGLVYLPYLQGERTPHMDASARGVFFGLTGAHTRAHIIRSVLEGISYSLRDCFEILRSTGLRMDQMRLTGGGAQSDMWMQMLASVLGTPLSRTTATEGPAFGAALLAAVGAGIYRDIPSACRATIRTTDVFTPDPAMRHVYDRGYEFYRSLYPDLKSAFRRAAELY